MFLQSKGFGNILSFEEGILRKDDECWPGPETPALEGADFRDSLGRTPGCHSSRLLGARCGVRPGCF